MVAGINGASNSPTNKKKTTDVAWSPAPPKKQEGKKVEGKTESLLQRLKRQKEEKQKLIDMM